MAQTFAKEHSGEYFTRYKSFAKQSNGRQLATLFRQRKGELTMLRQRISPTLGGLSSRQRRLQRHTRHMSFKEAVRLVADTLFHFTHCATQETSLWSDSVRVWMGSVTFIHLALEEVDMDIPRIVAGTDGAPDAEKDLREEVRLELLAFWADCLASLPSKNTPLWKSLP